jgi:hypothetical protein
MTTPRKNDPRVERWEKPETLFDAIEGTVHQASIPPKALAELLHVSLGDLYDLANPFRQRPLKVAQLVPLMKLSGDFRILRFLTEQCGFLLVKLPPVQLADDGSFRLARDVIRESAEAVDRYGQALEDDRVTAAEARDVARECQEAAAALMRIAVDAARRADGARS